jgi:hypothetical protein
MAMFATALLVAGTGIYLKWDLVWNLAHNPMLYFVGSMVR